MSVKTGVSYENVKWRSGGLYQLAQPYLARLFDPNGKGHSISEYRREVTWVITLLHLVLLRVLLALKLLVTSLDTFIKFKNKAGQICNLVEFGNKFL